MHPDQGRDLSGDQEPPPARRLVRIRIRIYLVDGGREVFADRRYLKAVDLSADGMPATETYLNQLLERVAVEHRDERPPGDYRLELHDQDAAGDAGEHVLDWGYIRPAPGWWA